MQLHVMKDIDTYFKSCYFKLVYVTRLRGEKQWLLKYIEGPLYHLLCDIPTQQCSKFEITLRTKYFTND